MRYTPVFLVILLSTPFFLFAQIQQQSDSTAQVRKPFPESFIQRFDYSANTINQAHKAFPSITGKGKVLSLKERRFDTLDIDLKNRWFLTSFSPSTQDVHATEMATVSTGSGNSGYTGKGVAWQASITPASFENLLPEPASYYKSLGITVQNHSYGTGIENEYAADASAYDLTMWNDTSLLHVFSAGNMGTAASSNGKYSGILGFSNLTGSFKMSKNSLAVGGTDSLNKVETLSSRGPAYDGRLKPELVAFGLDGSSGAAALVSGTALLIQQLIHQQMNAPPTASLVKALLIGSARDRGNSGPDYVQGYGRLDAYNALRLAKNNQWFKGNASSNNEIFFSIDIPSNTRSLKVTLCWTDTAGSPNAPIALVNDLDLEVLDPLHNSSKPWVLSTFPNADSLKKTAIRGNDHLNTVEQVFLDNPIQGTYRIKVSPFSLKTVTQKFSVVFDYREKDTLTITHPLRTEPVKAAIPLLIRWQQSFDDTKAADISYSLVGSNTWVPITQNIQAAKEYFSWQTPDINGLAILKVSVAGKTFVSDTFFIAKNFEVKTGFICGDTALLYWSPSPGINQYAVYTLGDTLMKQIALINDTLVKIPLSALNNKWVTIASKAPGNPLLEARVQSFNVFSQGAACYFKSFLAQLDNGGIRLSVSLGTTYIIKSLVIQKQLNGSFETLQALALTAELDYFYTDNLVQPGANTYRAVVLLNDGKTIYSEIQSVIQTGEEGWWVFPNPVKRGQRLYITNRRSLSDDLFVDIFDMHGRKAGTRLIPLIDNSFPVSNLAAGMYFLVFTDGKSRIGYQKIVVVP